jgi:hypothetical protein
VFLNKYKFKFFARRKWCGNDVDPPIFVRIRMWVATLFLGNTWMGEGRGGALDALFLSTGLRKVFKNIVLIRG